MKKILNSLIITFVVLFAGISTVFAGSATMSLSGSSVTKGSDATISINVSNITGVSDGKVYGAGGYITIDPEYLQLVDGSLSGEGGWSNMLSDKGSGRYMFALYGVGNGLSGKIGTIKFKALKAGSTTISLTEPDLSDKDENSLDATASGYTLTITEPAPSLDSDSKLKSLSVANYSLSPSFSAGTKAYTVSVPEGTTSVNISATANSSKAKSVTGTGTRDLTGDTTTLNVVCTAENNTSTTYTITVNRQKHVDPTPKSSDATLKALDVSGYSYSPAFNPNTTSYSMTVANGISELNVGAVPNDSKATVKIEGNYGWSVGKNTIKITVTAEDGTKKVYEVNVTRQAANPKVKSSDKNVDFKILNPHIIDPAFTNDNNNYTVTVPYDVKKLDLSVVPYDKNASVTISGNDKLTTDGPNTVTVKVTAEDGSSKTITLNVVRTEYKPKTDLLSLKVKDYEMKPKFKASTTKYSVTVPYNVDKVKVIAKVQEGSKYEVSGADNLRPGKNAVLVKVTDEKGFVKYYTINVNKEIKKPFLGIGLIPFLIILFLLLLLLLLLFLLLKRRKQKKEKVEEVKEEPKDESVHIDFKPEFNFNSKNGTDDDTVYSNGPMISGVDPKKLIDNQETIVDAKYDIYDDVVTKDELVDALNEGIKTKNVDKLQMLLDQENLNRKKKRLKKKEESVDEYEPAHSSDDYDEE